jgi:hypothetical protein
MKARVSACALSKMHWHFSLAIAASERLVTTACLIGALCFSSSAQAEGQKLWSRGFSSEPANSIDRAREFVLYDLSQNEQHLIGRWSYTNGAVGNETPPRVIVEGTKTIDGTFWPEVKLEVRKGQTGKWKRIVNPPDPGQPAEVTIEPNTTNFDLAVNLDAFKRLIGKCESGRIVLKTGRASVFELKDLLPPEQKTKQAVHISRFSTEIAEAQPRHIQELLDADFLRLKAQANLEEKAPVRQVKMRAGNDYFLLFSWKIGGGEYDFALVPLDREQAFIANFKPSRFGVGGPSRLKAIIAKLPSRSLIVWEEANDVGLELPPPRDVDGVVNFARTKNIRVELNPTLYECGLEAEPPEDKAMSPAKRSVKVNHLVPANDTELPLSNSTVTRTSSVIRNTAQPLPAHSSAAKEAELSIDQTLATPNSGDAVAEHDRHWDEVALPQSAVNAIRSDESTPAMESFRALSKTELNTALIMACRFGKLESAKTLVAVGAEPSFLVERHPAAGKESPLHYAVEPDNLNLVAYLLTDKGALHFERTGDSLELGTAAARGQVEATIMILDALRNQKPNRYQHCLKSAIVVIWNRQETAAIKVISRYRDYLPESSLASLQQSVAASDRLSSLRSLENVWRIARGEQRSVRD